MTHPSNRAYVAAHAQALRAAGGKRTSVELSPQAVKDLAALRAQAPTLSASDWICTALATLRAQRTTRRTK
jgi:hypothetical protein